MVMPQFPAQFPAHHGDYRRAVDARQRPSERRRTEVEVEEGRPPVEVAGQAS